MDLASSTVMTPSLPTFSMASAIRSPVVRSLLAAIVATWAISFRSFVAFDICFSAATTCSTACSMPRLRPIGLAPAVTFLSPSRTIAWARTVAVVVPSPAMSEVLAATSLTIWAPMFSNGSFSSISLATVTPSFVIVGLPNFLSMTTFRPLGPSVTLTAWDMMLTPRKIAARASSLNRSCLGMVTLPSACTSVGSAPPSGECHAPTMPRTSSSFMMRYSSLSSVTSLPEYLPNRIRSPAFTARGIFFPSSVTLPAADGDDLAFLRFLLGGVGDHDATTLDISLLEALYQDAVVQRAKSRLHWLSHGVDSSLNSDLCRCADTFVAIETLNGSRTRRASSVRPRWP